MIDFATLKRANAPLNAFIDWDESAEGGEGALAGVTMGVKANIAVRGLRWTGGLKTYRSRIASADAEVVAKLRSAGAIILGTLNMEEAALGSKTDNPHFGATQNPHRIGYSPGGSSGGSAAAVAAGLCDAALGTDTMGSVRVPAAHCGVYGFKPANNRVSQGGLEVADPAFDAIGPLARDLDMLESVSRVISDFGEGDLGGSSAVLEGHGVEVAAPVDAGFKAALAALASPPEQAALSHPNSRIRFAGFIQVSKFLAEHFSILDGLSPNLTKLLTYGPNRSAEDWAEDQVILETTHAEMRSIVAAHGFLIMPTVPNAAFLHSEREPAAQADFTCLANIAGLPAISIPAGWNDNGLPVGVQIVGQAGDERGLFRLGRQIDDKLSAYRTPPLKGE